MSDAIRKLIAETESLPKQDLPGFMSWAAGHPGIATYRTKSLDRYNDDLRRAYFLEEAQKRDPEFYRSSPDLLRAADPENLQALKSAYEPYGADHPLWGAVNWMQALPSAVYSTGQMLANDVDPVAKPYPRAYDQYAKAVNTLTGMEVAGKNNSRWRDMEDMRTAQSSIPWQVLDPREADQMINAAYDQKARPMEGDRFLEEAGVPETPAKYLGAVMDMTLDPYFGGTKAFNLARQGKRAAALKELVPEVGMGTWHLYVPPAVDALQGLAY